MARGTRVLAAAAMVAILASASYAGYTTEVLFSGDGSYLSDAGATPFNNGYSVFQKTSFEYSISSDMPEGIHCLYFMPDYSMSFRPELPGPGDVPVREVTIGAAGVNFDGQTASWSDLGLVWAPGYGIQIGQQFVPAMNGDALVGHHAWDTDGGGPDFLVEILAMKGSHPLAGAKTYRANFTLRRSLTWLSGQPIGTWIGGGMTPLLGGLPLEGLYDALSGFAPGLREWDRAAYGTHYEGSFRLTACATPVPEPATLLLLSGGLVGLIAARRKYNR